MSRGGRTAYDLEDLVRAFISLPVELMEMRKALRAIRDEIAGLRASSPPLLVGVKTAAERLGVSTMTIRRLIRAGELRYVRVGRSLRVDVSSMSRSVLTS